MSILEKITAHLEAHREVLWEGLFRDYLSLVLHNPELAKHAHARLYAMIRAAGIRTDDTDDKVQHYGFFDHDLYGIDEAIAKVVEYFKAASLGSDVGRRILLLYGPPSS